MSTTTKAVGEPVRTELPALSRKRKTKNVIATVLIWSAFLIAMIPLVWVLFTVVSRGLSSILELSWWTTSQRNIGAFDEGGGAAHAIVGTLVQAAIAALIAVPIGILAGILLVEYPSNRLLKPVSFMTDVLTGIPSIVSALFIYALFITTLGFNRSGIMVSFALVILMLPVIVRGTEEMLRIVPNELREASYALGVPRWKTIMRIVVPTAFTGIVTAVMLGLARIMGETAPLLILVGYTPSINANPFAGEQAALPLMINVERQNPLPAGQDRAWGAALTLILIVMLLNLGARYLSRFSGVKK
jgi:phosphate transport system permease protein